MFEQIHLQLAQDHLERGAVATAVAREFPSIHLDFDRIGVHGPTLRATEWQEPRFDWWAFDTKVDAAEALHLVDDLGRPLPFTLEVLNRCQRVIGRRNQYSECEMFERVLRAHREAYASEKPLVIADYRHALDVWQWVLRLDGDATLSLQIAALFHDIERLATEADERIEQHAADYQAFKNAHASRGAELTAAILEKAGVGRDIAGRVAAIIRHHEARSDDPEIATLNDADGLSFFSLNSSGYADYFGREQTRRKVAWTWNRMRTPARERLAHVRLRQDVADILRRHQGERVMELSSQQIEQRVHELGNWFHNLDLKGVKTAPDHFLGDYPNIKWQRFAHAVPRDLTGKSVLDVGCNAGFYSIEMKKRGADRVVAIDSDDVYLEQARFAASVSGFDDIEFRKLSVYDTAQLGEQFDVVIFMGVLYHLRHPLLALDILHGIVRETMIFQSMQRGDPSILPLADDYPFRETAIFDESGYPHMHFVEKRYAGDPTNWWIPNRACVEAMLRSAGFVIVDHPEDEVYICRRGERPDIKDA